MKSKFPTKLKIGGEVILPGQTKRIELEAADLYDYTSLKIPIEVIRSEAPGPSLFVCAAIHGDEINGVEIIKRLLRRSALKRMRGTLIVAPVINVFGFNHKSRYLPDRRDLNRCFPGSNKGSLAARLAALIMKEVVSKCSYGIDLHTGAMHRTNLPQIRATLDQGETEELAKAFGAPVVVNSETRDGSLREAARRKGVCMLVYEGGEALRFDENSIRTGLNGCLEVMRKIEMLPPAMSKDKSARSYVAQDSYWIRAPRSGSFRFKRKLGDRVNQGDVVATITDLFGRQPAEVLASEDGIIIGMSMIPLVNRGDAMFHIATFKNLARVHKAIGSIESFDEE